MWTNHKNKLIILGMLMVLAVTTGVGCKGGDRDAQAQLAKNISLEVWGVFDSQNAFSDLIKAYNATRPNIRIKYRKLQFKEYEQALLEAWTENRGPDIFMVHNTWVGDYTKKIQIPPETIRLATAIISGDLKKTVTARTISYKSITPIDITNQFVSIVAQDAVRDGSVYGLPLSVDTLVLYYNRAILDQAGVPAIPSTWQEIKEASQKITLIGQEDQILRSGIALGSADNINRSFDILSLLMAQNGATFLDPTGNFANFSRGSLNTSDASYRPGQEALRFYTDFASPNKEVYTWSEDLPSAQESFVSGSLGMMLGYNYHLPFLKSQGPKIQLGIAPAPHINSDGTDATGETVNWANYWLLSVSNSTEHPNQAWDFIHFATTKPDNAKLYLDKTNKPTALRSLIGEQQADAELGVFAEQLLTAQSWYTGKNTTAAEGAFADMIKSIVSGSSTIKDAIGRAEKTINQIFR